MNLSFAGRVRNTHLPYTHALLPLFEAIVNSIHAIEDGPVRPGKIQIEILRDSGGSVTHSSLRATGNIVGFSVVDDGTGFTDANFTSFETSDSEYKLSRGAKGVGRFVWLKAFDSVHVESVYRSGDKFAKRSFSFDLPHNGIYDPKAGATDATSTYTRLELKGFKPKYVEECPKRASTIADHIVEYCLFYLLDAHCPVIEVRDPGEGETIVVNERFRTIVQGGVTSEEVLIGTAFFKLQHVHLYSTEGNYHEIHLCGDRRDVVGIRLNNRIPELRQKIQDKDGGYFNYYVYASSPALDAAVNAERTSFNLTKEGPIGLNGELTMEGILDAIVVRARQHLQEPIGEIHAGMKRRVENLVTSVYPEHRAILKYMDEHVEEFTPSMKDDEIALKLNEIQFKEDIKTREEARELTEKAPTDDDSYKQQLDHYMNRMSEFRQSRLAQYVIHRKCILELMRKRLDVQTDGKYSKEEHIHKVMFPVRTTSDDIQWNQQNLWLLDEGLAYHHYLASDKPFCSIHIDSSSKDRPDVVVFNNPGVFSDSDNDVLNHVTLIEFKRPERDSYGTLREQPVEQIYRYIREIKQGQIKTASGRTIQVHAGTQFHCYVICDITKELRTYLEDHNFAATADQGAYYGFAEKHKAYVEIISFNRLLTASENRNRVLFKSLGLLP